LILLCGPLWARVDFAHYAGAGDRRDYPIHRVS
jgi:hypothetical protein